MKKIIFLLAILISNIAYSQVCPTQQTRSDSVIACKLKVKNLASGLMKASSIGNVSIATAGTDYTTPTGSEALTNKTYNGITLTGSSTPTLAVTGTTTVSGTNTGDQTYIGSLIQEADATNFVTSATVPYYKNKSYAGTLFKWDFTNGTAGWSSSGSGTTWALNGNYLQCSGGGGATDYTNFYKYDSYQGIATGSQAEISGFIPTVNASNAGEGLAIGLKSNNGVLDILAKVDLSNTATRGQLTIYRVISGTAFLLATSASNLSFTTNSDNLSLRITKKPNNTADAKFINNTTGASVNLQFNSAIGSTFVFKVAIYHFGGTQKIPISTLKNTTSKSKKTILVGDSVTLGYSTYFISAVKGDASNEAGSGASSSDLVNTINDIINSGGINAIVMIGMNDAIASVSSSDYMTNVRRVVNALREAGITPIISYVTPSADSGVNVFIQSYNTALLAEYNGVYTIVDTYSILSVGNNLTGLLSGTYDSGDGIHPNAAGYQLITSTIAHDAIAVIPSNSPSLAETQTFTGTNTFASTVHSGIGIGTSPSAVLHIAQNFTGAAQATTGVGFRIDAATYTDNTSSGTVANKRVNVLGVPTLAATNTTTYTNATTWYFPSPAAGTNVTNTNIFSIETQGNILSGGNVHFANSGSATGILVPSATRFRILTGGSNEERLRITSSTGLIGIGPTAPTPSAYLTIAAGAAGTNLAPLKFTTGGTQLTTPENLVVEPETGDANLLFTTGAGARYTLAKTLTNTATLDFASTAAGAVADLTITVTGAALNDAVSVGVPNGAVTATATFTAWVSATNTVTVRFSPKATEDPASGTFRVSVIKY